MGMRANILSTVRSLPSLGLGVATAAYSFARTRTTSIAASFTVNQLPTTLTDLNITTVAPEALLDPSLENTELAPEKDLLELTSAPSSEPKFQFSWKGVFKRTAILWGGIGLLTSAYLMLPTILLLGPAYLWEKAAVARKQQRALREQENQQ
ncbi:MAG: hypothetical protein ABH823_03915 [bacterium]